MGSGRENSLGLKYFPSHISQKCSNKEKVSHFRSSLWSDPSSNLMGLLLLGDQALHYSKSH